ncbi:hypothetical protein CC85DRAFT_298665 [Cutaneotrichosporon oleaginosum]|uniref:Uncharacterized protein n=1 Tax=Cutaneotrichosporon oleaginosum TaxID=879819 RepID=A0A0J0XZM5_9TREE|nr:uncharacterized protein CC85DRAFT_298665 [Cutaneotrichosporon oleaginosum]KLT46471.1 hypothetical protein CC85DRAFT_298665 [Cutaneotrichosporon oleaginosum]TXT15161.1 hypothetical protein COLE_01354 [Cutaneotrichosporon oleaginosum]
MLDICSLSTPALAAFLLLPSILGIGTVASASRGNLAALQAAPLAAGSLAGLLILRQPDIKLILAIGALAAIPFLLALFSHQPTTFSLANGHTSRKDKPASLNTLDRFSPASPNTRTSTTPTTVPCTPAGSDSGDVFRSTYLDKVTVSLSQCSRAPTRSPPPLAMLNGALAPFPVTPVTVVSSASTRASSTHENALAEAQAAPLLPAPTFEEEFARYVARTAARCRPEEPPVSFGSWPKEWPVYWEGAGLARKGCW